MTVGSLLILIFFLALFVWAMRTFGTANTPKKVAGQSTQQRTQTKPVPSSTNQIPATLTTFPFRNAAFTTLATSAIFASAARSGGQSETLNATESINIQHLEPVHISSEGMDVTPATDLSMTEPSFANALDTQGLERQDGLVDQATSFPDAIEPFDSTDSFGGFTDMFGDW